MKIGDRFEHFIFNQNLLAIYSYRFCSEFPHLLNLAYVKDCYNKSKTKC
jgi:hypothetical protein